MRHTFVDTGDEVIEVPWAEIEGQKQRTDGSWNFKLVGGPYNGHTVRVYPPCNTIVFPTEPEPLVYEIHPPLKQDGKWCYVYNPLATDPKEKGVR